MKVSVSLPDEDVHFLDACADSVGLLRASDLGPAYEEAWDESSTGDDAEARESSASRGSG